MSLPFPPQPADDLLNHPLWRLEFADGDLCLAKANQKLYLVLFTSPEQAKLFQKSQPEQQSAAPLLFSQSEAQFEQAALKAFENGVQGAVINPNLDGLASLFVDFSMTAVPDQVH